MKTEISTYLETSPYIQNQLVPFYSSEAGRLMMARTERVVREQLPHYVREVEGLAAGAEQDLRTMLMLNFNFPRCGKDVLDKGCTTIIVPAGDTAQPSVLGHTEDGPPEARGKMFIMEVEIPASQDSPGENFTALSYPGSLAGRALGVNHLQGFVWSMNSVSPATTTTGIRLGALLQCVPLAANGCSLNIADSQTALNIEISPRRHRVTRLERNTAMVHCNMYRHLSVRQLEDVHYWSSQARHARLDSRAGQIKTEEEVRFWLGDQEGELPVFRTDDKEKDVLLTLATGIFNIENREMKIYIGNPREENHVYRRELICCDSLEQHLCKTYENC